MDRRIYGKGYRNDYGQYVTRRFPKGSSGAVESVGPTLPTDPAANPLSIDVRYNGFPLAPHASTERFTYTVPPGRRAVIQSAMSNVTRVTAAAPASNFNAAIHIYRKGKTVADVVTLVSSQAVDNTVGYSKQGLVGTPIDLFEGDTIRGATDDSSTGGTVNYALHVLGIEFDAVYRNVGSAKFFEQNSNESGVGAGGGSGSGDASSAPLLGYAPDPRYPWR